MPSSKRDIIRDIVEMQQDMMRTFQDFLLGGKPVPLLHGRSWIPPTDVYETAEEFIIRCEIPGITDPNDSKELEVTAEGDTVIIRGRREAPPCTPGRQFRQMEICYGPFERIVALPVNIDSADITASYSGGFLEINISKATARRKRTKVNVRG